MIVICNIVIADVDGAGHGLLRHWNIRLRVVRAHVAVEFREVPLRDRSHRLIILAEVVAHLDGDLEPSLHECAIGPDFRYTLEGTIAPAVCCFARRCCARR